MLTHEKKVFKALFDIQEELEKLDKTLEKLTEADNKVKCFIEQEKAIHEIKKIAHMYDKIEKYDAKDIEKYEAKVAEWDEKYTKKHTGKIAADVEAQEKSLAHIVNAVDKLNEELDKLGNDDGKIKSYIAQKKAAHQIKKILHSLDLYENYVEDEIENIEKLL